MGIIKSVIKVSNEINKTGELVLKENRYEAIYFLGVKVHERDFQRDTEQSAIKIKGDASEVGFKSNKD